MNILTRLLYSEYYKSTPPEELNTEGFGTGVISMKQEAIEEMLASVDWEKVDKLIKEN